jgi:hypothetical protein
LAATWLGLVQLQRMGLSPSYVSHPSTKTQPKGV